MGVIFSVSYLGDACENHLIQSFNTIGSGYGGVFSLYILKGVNEINKEKDILLSKTAFWENILCF